MFVILIALLVATQVIRNAAVVALAPVQPAVAARFWSDHPAVELSGAMAEIGTAARLQQNVGQGTFDRIHDAAIKAPLAPEPFLVRGVEAQMSGDMKLAKEAFSAAQWRDPRSVPASYFLAEYYYRTGHILEGLEQTALLTRLVPEATATVAPYLAAYAKDRSTWAQIRTLFRGEGNLEQSVLVALAQDPANADAILALADPSHRGPESNWLPVLLNKLVESGNYSKAHQVWSNVGRVAEQELIYDAGFSKPAAPPPFNWALTTGTVGLAERQSGGKLHVLFYGNQDGVLAKQLLLLTPGAYQLQMSVAGAATNPQLLSWSVRCDPSTEPFARMAVEGGRTRATTIRVPPNCPAQWIELSGRSGDVAEQSEATIGRLSLSRARLAT